MKLISWNVNGIRACIGKGFEESFHALDADIFCLQETKCQGGQVNLAHSSTPNIRLFLIPACEYSLYRVGVFDNFAL